MGGDAAPEPEIEGAILAVREQLARVVLVGDRAKLDKAVHKHGKLPDGLTLHHASQVITMEDQPASAAKSKKDSSMRIAFELAKRGEVDAVVSAGNSGAFMACGLFVMKRLRGVDRPGVIATFPTKSGRCALIDMGANVDCQARTLAQFAVLGTTYSATLHGKEKPRVGLLSNGEEESKGTELTREAHRLLSSQKVERAFDYRGYVEGRDIFEGEVDVVVTDGFTGNVVLKTAEGVGQVVMEMLKEEILATTSGKVGALLLRGAFRRLKKRVDYDEAGGAPLVGLDGVPILCHGRSTPKAIKNAVRMAAQLADAGLTRAVTEGIAHHAPMWANEVNEASGT
jgi:glycerol-3-phosphate acyltransferase PlsX